MKMNSAQIKQTSHNPATSFQQRPFPMEHPLCATRATLVDHSSVLDSTRPQHRGGARSRRTPGIAAGPCGEISPLWPTANAESLRPHRPELIDRTWWSISFPKPPQKNFGPILPPGRHKGRPSTGVLSPGTSRFNMTMTKSTFRLAPTLRRHRPPVRAVYVRTAHTRTHRLPGRRICAACSTWRRRLEYSRRQADRWRAPAKRVRRHDTSA